jgi:hypothetical protein
MNTVIRTYLMDWRSARVAMRKYPGYRSAVALQQTYRKHRRAVRISLQVINGKA